MNNNKNIATTILLVDNEPDSISVLSMGLEDGGSKLQGMTEGWNQQIDKLSELVAK